MTHTTVSEQDIENVEEEEKKRRKLLLLLLLFLLLLCCVGFFVLRYLISPRPLPEMVPVANAINYPPHYLFSIYGLDKPVGVTASPDGERIYGSETSGERLVKIFSRDGAVLGSFAPPDTNAAERSPVYLAMDSNRRVFVSDRLQDAVFIYDSEGNYLDSILSPDTTLSKYLTQHLGGSMPEGTTYYYNIFSGLVRLTQPGIPEQELPAPDLSKWDPLGVRFNRRGDLLVTIATDHTVRVFPTESMTASSFADFNPPTITFGGYGQEAGQMLYPNTAVVDSRGRIYVTDGNNGRVSVWDLSGNYLFDFAKGSAEGSLSLPRGGFIDERDRLFVVDAVGQDVKVYDVAGDTPVFLYTFGDFGIEDGLFNYPADIFVDGTGRLYIADRENNRIQVWSY